MLLSFPSGSVVKNLPANVGDTGDNPWVGKIPVQYSCILFFFVFNYLFIYLAGSSLSDGTQA